MRLGITVLKFVVGAIGVLVFVYHNELFIEYAREGTRLADPLHKILINNHGSYSYITAEQALYLRSLDVLAVSLIGLMIVIDILQRTVFRKGG